MTTLGYNTGTDLLSTAQLATINALSTNPQASFEADLIVCNEIDVVNRIRLLGRYNTTTMVTPLTMGIKAIGMIGDVDHMQLYNGANNINIGPVNTVVNGPIQYSPSVVDDGNVNNLVTRATVNTMIAGGGTVTPTTLTL